MSNKRCSCPTITPEFKEFCEFCARNLGKNPNICFVYHDITAFYSHPLSCSKGSVSIGGINEGRGRGRGGLSKSLAPPSPPSVYIVTFAADPAFPSLDGLCEPRPTVHVGRLAAMGEVKWHECPLATMPWLPLPLVDSA